MKLHDPRFERALRQKVRQTVRRSRPLRKARRSLGRRRAPHFWLFILRPTFSLLLAFLAWQSLLATGQLTAALAVVVLWTTLTSVFDARRLLVSLYASPDLPALMLLPIPETRVFQWRVGRFHQMTRWNLLDPLFAYLALAGAWQAQGKATPLLWAAVVPVAFLTWKLCRSLAWLGAGFLPRFPFHVVSGLMFILGLGLFCLWESLGESAIRWLIQVAPMICLVLPPGWPAAAFQALAPGGDLLLFALLLPTLLLIATERYARARVQSTYQFGEVVEPEAPELIPGPVPAVIGGKADGSQPRLGATQVEDLILSRRGFTAPEWRNLGVLERWFGRWLTAREQALTELVFPDGIRLTRPWKRVFLILVATFLMAVPAGLAGQGSDYLVLTLGFVVVGVMILARLQTVGRAFQPFLISGVNIPHYAGFGIGYLELSRLLFKYSLVQTPFVLGATVLACGGVHWMAELPLAAGVVMGVKCGGLLQMSRGPMLALAFSNGTDDTVRFRLRTLFLVLVMVGCGLLFLMLGGASLFVPDPMAAWLLWGLAGVDAYAFYRIYGWCYHTFRFDIISQPRG